MMKSKLLLNKIKFIFFYFMFVNAQFIYAGPGNFTWNGSTNFKWSTASNWTPNGIPLASDSITIVDSPNNLTLDCNRTINLFTVNSGTIDLNGYTLSVNGKCLFKGGVVDKGQLLISNASSITFSGTTFETRITATCYSIYFNGSIFEDSVSITKIADSNDNSLGGNHFNNHVLLSNTSAGAIVLADSFPDVFEKTFFVKNTTEKGGIYLAHRASGNLFKGDVVFTGRFIFSNYYGTAEYRGNIILNCPNGQIYFGASTGSCTLANTYRIQLGDSVFSSGKLSLRHFTKLGAEGSTELSLTGSALLELDGSSFSTPVVVVAPGITIKNTRFLNEVLLTKNGSSTSTSAGGCYFAAATSITNNNSNGVFTLGSIFPDTFAVATTILNTHGTLNINNARFEGAVTLKNIESIGGGDRFYVAATGNCFFNNALTIDNIGTGFCFGNSTGSTILSASSTLSFAAGFNGYLTMRNFSKLNTNSQTINFPYATTSLTLGPNSLFNGNFNYSGRSISLNGTTFNGAVSITKNGTYPDTCQGGNVFNSSVMIKDSTNAAHQFIWGYNQADDFNGDVTFSQKGTGVAILPAYKKNSNFAGNIYLEGTSAIQFGANGGKVIFDGSTNSSINNATYYTPTIKKLQVNKSLGYVTLNSPILISDSLILSSGRVNTDSTNLISLARNSKLNGGSDVSYINGPIKKIGSNAFVFPLGSPTLAHPYHPLEITSPTTSTDSYTAQYFSHGQTISSAIDTSIDNLNACHYWKLNRNSGTSTVKAKLNWNNDSCESISPSNYRVTGWNGSMWKDLGNGNTSGDSIVGSVQSLDYLSTISILTLAFHKCSAFRKTIMLHGVRCAGSNDGYAELIVKGGTSQYHYLWSDGQGTSSIASNLKAGKYFYEVNDNRNCILNDSIHIFEPDSISLLITKTNSTCGNRAGMISGSPNGGTPPYNYFWPLTGDTSYKLTDIFAGSYTLQITDSEGCNVFSENAISDTDGPGMNILSQINLDCYGSDTASIEVEGADGKWPFTYQWNTIGEDSTAILTNLKPEIYVVKITNNSGCSSYDTVTITGPNKIQIDFSTTPTACGSSTGTITAQVTGGTSPYSYAWSGSIYTDSVLIGLPSGLDTLTVTDVNGCIAVNTGELFNSSGLTLTPVVISHVTCFPHNLGSATVLVSGGTSPYSYLWRPNGGTNDTAYNLPSDNYSVIVVDATGCRKSVELSINGVEELKVFQQIIQPSTDSSNDGKARAVVTGGVSPFTFDWSNGTHLDSIIGLGVGEDTLIVMGGNGCIDSSIFRIIYHPINNCSNCAVSSCGPFSSLPCTGCTSVLKNIRTDFGALGDGETNDQCAFEEASAYFQSLPYNLPKILEIPSGTYIVGRQEPSLLFAME